MTQQIGRPSTLTKESAASRDAGTFEDFFNAEQLRLLRAVFLITTDRAEAEDVTQEAFLKVLERWDRVRRMEKQIGYLYRTALNIARSRARRVARALRRSGALSQPDQLAMTEDREAVIQTLKMLTPRQRIALVLTELLDYDTEEAAQVMRVKAGTVRSLASRARASLREQWEDLDA
jgi:RNA polymerase sigma-70 factor (ECF subfamily)